MNLTVFVDNEYNLDRLASYDYTLNKQEVVRLQVQ